MAGTPFLFGFAEGIEQVEFQGSYNPKLQMVVGENDALTVNHTITETATGGYHDTDSDVDA